MSEVIWPVDPPVIDLPYPIAGSVRCCYKVVQICLEA